MDIVAGVQMGGIAWGDSLPQQYANNVVAVATFGDVADRTGGSLPTQSALLGSRAIDLCNFGDPIRHAGPGNAWSGHTEGYVPGYTTQAAAFVAAKLMAGPGLTMPGDGPLPGYGQATPGYGPEASMHGPPPGYGAQTPGFRDTDRLLGVRNGESSAGSNACQAPPATM